MFAGIVIMGSGAETARETADYLNARGERVGLVQEPFVAGADIAELEREGGPSHGFRNMITAARLIAAAALIVNAVTASSVVISI